MKYITILGATSQIATDLVPLFLKQCEHEFTLFARRPEVVTEFMAGGELAGRYRVADFPAFGSQKEFHATLNFVGGEESHPGRCHGSFTLRCRDEIRRDGVELCASISG